MVKRGQYDPHSAAKAVVKRLAKRESDHLKVCGKCHQAGVNVYDRCEDGWQLAREVSRAKYAAADFSQPGRSDGTQKGLW